MIISHLPKAVAALSLFCGSLFTASTFAVESQTTPVLALRLSKTLPEGAYFDATINARSYEGFVGHEREIFELRGGKRIGSNEFSAAYNVQFDRQGSPGSEHRLWQQFRHQFALESSNFESSVRLEERYFEATDAHGSRLRVLNRWNKSLPYGNLLRLGYEWVFNLEDVTRTTQRGVAQDRLIGTVQHNLQSGNRVEFEYQMRYLHLPGQDNMLQHQLQLMYVITL